MGGIFACFRHWLTFAGKLALWMAVAGTCLPANAQSPACGCADCPQDMPDGYNEVFVLQIAGAQNPIVGQNGQALCGVSISLTHEYIADILITLTAPNGTTVTLIGPVLFYNPTTATTWDVTFVPCADTVAPDKPFSGQWNNEQPWGAFGNYDGTYHPYAGCLEDFLGSPVNGEWQLAVVDGLPNDGGVFLNYKLIFCDDSGIECEPCAAAAGNLLENDLTACAGHDSLLLHPEAKYINQQTPPPVDQYGYTFLIGGAGGMLLSYADTADLRLYPPGDYTVCGLSYLLTDEPALPAPDSVLTIQQLAVALDSILPPFCGDVTSNCIGISIVPPIPDSVLTTQVCEGACVSFFGKSYCASGTFVDTIVQGNCRFSATLHLDVRTLDTVYLEEAVCAGQCATIPGFATACDSGTYVITQPDLYGCDSTTILHLLVLDPKAETAPAPYWPCGQDTALLPATNVPAGAQLLWTPLAPAQSAGPVDNDTLYATAPGTFRLSLCLEALGATCCAISTVEALHDTIQPAEPVWSNAATLLCAGEELTASIFPAFGAEGYSWSWPQGFEPVQTGTDTFIALRHLSGPGGEVCVLAYNACAQSDPVCIEVLVGFSPPGAGFSGPNSVCRGAEVWYVLTGVVADSLNRGWQVDGGKIIEASPDSILVAWDAQAPSGMLTLRITSVCGESPEETLSVQFIEPPDAGSLAGDSVFCAGAQTQIVYTPPGNANSWSWTLPGIGNVTATASGNDSITIDWPVPGTGPVCVSAENACGLGPESCMDITVNAVPAANVAALVSVCGLSTPVEADSVQGGAWISAPGLTFADPFSYKTVVEAGSPGNYSAIWRVVQNNCIASDTLELHFFERPSLSDILPICGSDTGGFILNIWVAGGKTPYSSVGVNGSFVGNLLTTSLLPNNSAVDFFALDANNCASDTLFFSDFSCACTTFAGSMPEDTAHLCPGDTLRLPPAAGVVLGPEDTLVYALHDQWGPAPGNVIFQQGTPEFAFKAPLTPEKTYFVSAIAYRKALQNDDPCRSVSNETPVIWHNAPSAALLGDASTCAGDSIRWQVNGTGKPPILVQIADETGQLYSLGLPNGATAVWAFPVFSDGYRQIVRVQDAYCSNTEQASPKLIEVYPLPVADAGADQVATCLDTSFTLDGSASNGAGQPLAFQWRKNGIGLTNQALLVEAGTGTYVLEVSNTAGCVDTDTIMVLDGRNPPLLTKVTKTDVLCFGQTDGRIAIDSVTGGTPPLMFRLNDGVFSDQLVFENLEPGVYQLEVEDITGCRSTVSLNIDMPAEIKFSIGPDVEAAFGDTVYLSVWSTVSQPAIDTVIWHPIPQEADPSTKALSWIARQTIQIDATLIDTNGCSASDTVLVRVYKKQRVYIPNVFSPGQAGNDRWWVYAGAEVSEVEQVAVFDRWGNEVFRKQNTPPNNAGVGWDGRFAGKKASAGVYVYHVRLRLINGETIEEVGSLTILGED